MYGADDRPAQVRALNRVKTVVGDRPAQSVVIKVTDLLSSSSPTEPPVTKS